MHQYYCMDVLCVWSLLVVVVDVESNVETVD